MAFVKHCTARSQPPMHQAGLVKSVNQYSTLTRKTDWYGNEVFSYDITFEQQDTTSLNDLCFGGGNCE